MNFSKKTSRDLEIKIIKTEDVQENNNKNSNHSEESKHEIVINGSSHDYESQISDDDDYLVIELVNGSGDADQAIRDQEIQIKNDVDSYVNIHLSIACSKQLLVYLARRSRLYIRCRIRAVSQGEVIEKCRSSDVIVYLKPCYRISVKKTENWYYNYCHTVYLKRNGSSVNRQSMSPGCQRAYLDESSKQVSKLTQSGEFSLSYEEKSSKMKRIEKDIDICDDVERPMLKRSYSIEFLNEESNQSFSNEQIASRIEQGDGEEIYHDSDDEDRVSEDSHDDDYDEGKSVLKRSFSIEFLNENESDEEVFSPEMVAYQINKGEGTMVYSDLEHQSDSCRSVENEDGETSILSRSFSIEFLDESLDKKSTFSYETISNKIESGEGQLVYADEESPKFSRKTQFSRKVRTPSQKLKTVVVHMDVSEDDEVVPLGEQNKNYRIEYLDEREQK